MPHQQAIVARAAGASSRPAGTPAAPEGKGGVHGALPDTGPVRGHHARHPRDRPRDRGALRCPWGDGPGRSRAASASIATSGRRPEAGAHQVTTAPTAPAAYALRAARRRARCAYTRSRPCCSPSSPPPAAGRSPGSAVRCSCTAPGPTGRPSPVSRWTAPPPAPPGAVRENLSAGGALFDQEDAGHCTTRRALVDNLGAAGVERLRPVWRNSLNRRLAPLGAGRDVDLVPLAHDLAGATVRALLETTGAPEDIAAAAAAAAAAAVRDQMPGPRRPGTARVVPDGRAPHAWPPPRLRGWKCCSPLPLAGPVSQLCGPCSRSPPSTSPSRPFRAPPPGAPTQRAAWAQAGASAKVGAILDRFGPFTCCRAGAGRDSSGRASLRSGEGGCVRGPSW